MSEIIIPCGGNSEIIIGCLGNNEVGNPFQTVKEIVSNLVQFGFAPKIEGFSYFQIGSAILIVLFLLILFIIYKKKK